MRVRLAAGLEMKSCGTGRRRFGSVCLGHVGKPIGAGYSRQRVQGHCQLNQARSCFGSRRKLGTSCCGALGARLLLPDPEGGGPHGTVGSGRRPMPSRMKMPVNEGVGRQEALGLPCRLEPLHLSFPASGWPMRVLSPIVQIAALPVLDLRQ